MIISNKEIEYDIEKNAPIMVFRANPDTLKLDLIKRTNKDESFVYDCDKKVSNRYGNKMTLVITNENKYSFKDEDIDPEILTIVKNFNDAGIETIFSCQGHFNEDIDESSIPYLLINYPKNDILTSLIFKRLNRYPMLRIVTGRNPNFELFDNTDHTKVSDYSKLLDKVIDETDDATIDISVNPIMYNIPEEFDSSSRKEIFEYLRKRFLTELLQLSEELLKESIRNTLRQKEGK